MGPGEKNKNETFYIFSLYRDSSQHHLALTKNLVMKQVLSISSRELLIDQAR
jgi:hypothetical protein